MSLSNKTINIIENTDDENKNKVPADLSREVSNGKKSKKLFDNEHFSNTEQKV